MKGRVKDAIIEAPVSGRQMMKEFPLDQPTWQRLRCIEVQDALQCGRLEVKIRRFLINAVITDEPEIEERRTKAFPLDLHSSETTSLFGHSECPRLKRRSYGDVSLEIPNRGKVYRTKAVAKSGIRCVASTS